MCEFLGRALTMLCVVQEYLKRCHSLCEAVVETNSALNRGICKSCCIQPVRVHVLHTCLKYSSHLFIARFLAKVGLEPRYSAILGLFIHSHGT